MKKCIKSYIYLAALLAFVTQGASARADNGVVLQYDVYAGGLKALSAALRMDIEHTAYDLALSAETQGMIGSLFPWKASYVTQGSHKNGALSPATYVSTSHWRKDIKVTEMTYSANGTVEKSIVHEGGKTRVTPQADPALSRDSFDLLSGTLMIMETVGKTNKCAGKIPVFDGKRRFNIVLSDGGKDVLHPTTYSSFSGEATRCTFKVEPVAGFSKKDRNRGWMAVQNHTEKHQKAPTIWLASLDGMSRPVPVRMEIGSDYGAVVAHLINIPEVTQLSRKTAP